MDYKIHRFYFGPRKVGGDFDILGCSRNISGTERSRIYSYSDNRCLEGAYADPIDSFYVLPEGDAVVQRTFFGGVTGRGIDYLVEGLIIPNEVVRTFDWNVSIFLSNRLFSGGIDACPASSEARPITISGDVNELLPRLGRGDAQDVEELAILCSGLARGNVRKACNDRKQARRWVMRLFSVLPPDDRRRLQFRTGPGASAIYRLHFAGPEYRPVTKRDREVIEVNRNIGPGGKFSAIRECQQLIANRFADAQQLVRMLEDHPIDLWFALMLEVNDISHIFGVSLIENPRVAAALQLTLAHWSGEKLGGDNLPGHNVVIGALEAGGHIVALDRILSNPENRSHRIERVHDTLLLDVVADRIRMLIAGNRRIVSWEELVASFAVEERPADEIRQVLLAVHKNKLNIIPAFVLATLRDISAEEFIDKILGSRTALKHLVVSINELYAVSPELASSLWPRLIGGLGAILRDPDIVTEMIGAIVSAADKNIVAGLLSEWFAEVAGDEKAINALSAAVNQYQLMDFVCDLYLKNGFPEFPPGAFLDQVATHVVRMRAGEAAVRFVDGLEADARVVGRMRAVVVAELGAGGVLPNVMADVLLLGFVLCWLRVVASSRLGTKDAGLMVENVLEDLNAFLSAAYGLENLARADAVKGALEAAVSRALHVLDNLDLVMLTIWRANKVGVRIRPMISDKIIQRLIEERPRRIPGVPRIADLERLVVWRKGLPQFLNDPVI